MDNVGRVELVRSEVCIVRGMEGAGLGNVVAFSSGARGIILGFNRADVEIVMLKNFNQVKKGDLVRIVADRMKVNVNEALLGRIIDPLGVPLDGLGALDIPEDAAYPIEAVARPVYQRAIINRPLKTGFLTIDSQIPIGLGQRELLLGEKKSGQSDLAVDVICNQARLNTDMICIYIGIDTETAGVKRRMERIQKNGALNRTIAVIGRTAEAASLNYIAPMVGITIAEWFAAKGKDVLVVFDDLTRHAKVYRQMSLLLERPASREAYPGDVFYLHSRLLERCGAFSQDAGGGTITSLPIVETQSEDATDYITTNLMSITDGHVLFRKTLANKGNQPPIDNGFSVSRIGGRAQVPLIRALSEKLKGVTIRYEEVARFMSFGSDLGPDSLAAYDLGVRSQIIFQQSHDDFYTSVEESVLMYFIVAGAAKRWSERQIPEVVTQLLAFTKRAPYDTTLNDTILTMPYDHVEVILNEFINDFTHDKATAQPEQKVERLTAEIESIDGLLKNDEELLK